MGDVVRVQRHRPHRRRLEAEIRRGLETGEFVLAWQPQVDLATGRIAGAEALARWHTPDGTVRQPAEFVPAAEQSGLIVPLGEQLLEQAFRRAAILTPHAPPDFVTWVNVSPVQILDADVAGLVLHTLDLTGADPRSVGLEVTETALLVDQVRAARVIDEVRALGVGVALDDFGTGYSSMLYLKHFDFDVLKLAQDYVAGFPGDDTDRVIVEAVVTVAHSLGMRTVAEGIETPAQCAALNHTGCDLGQGYLFGRPAPASCLREMLREQSLEHPHGPALASPRIEEVPA